jgi:hypothetical protein
MKVGGECSTPRTSFQNPACFPNAQCLHFPIAFQTYILVTYIWLISRSRRSLLLRNPKVLGHIYGVLKMHVDFWVENINITNEDFLIAQIHKCINLEKVTHLIKLYLKTDSWKNA